MKGLTRVALKGKDNRIKSKSHWQFKILVMLHLVLICQQLVMLVISSEPLQHVYFGLFTAFILLFYSIVVL